MELTLSLSILANEFISELTLSLSILGMHCVCTYGYVQCAELGSLLLKVTCLLLFITFRQCNNYIVQV